MCLPSQREGELKCSGPLWFPGMPKVPCISEGPVRFKTLKWFAKCVGLGNGDISKLSNSIARRPLVRDLHGTRGCPSIGNSSFFYTLLFDRMMEAICFESRKSIPMLFIRDAQTSSHLLLYEGLYYRWPEQGKITLILETLTNEHWAFAK